MSIDPAVLVAAIVQRLQGVVAREIAPGEFAVLTVGRIAAGSKSECAASGSPKDPEFEMFDSFPLTENDAAVTQVVADAFADHFGEAAFELARQSASEDFSDIPRAFGVPYTYWGIGGIDPETYANAEAAGTVQADIPANHSPHFAPVIQPTLRVGTAAAVVAAMAWLG